MDWLVHVENGALLLGLAVVIAPLRRTSDAPATLKP